MAVTEDYKKAQSAVDTAYKNAVTNANKAIATKNEEINEAYSDINEKAATRRGLSAFKNASLVNGEGQTATSKLSESVNYENMLNKNASANTAAKEALAQQALELGYTASGDLASAYATNLTNRLAAQTDERQFNYENELTKEEQEYDQALETLNEFGKVMTKNQAKILGVPVGTTLKQYTSSSQRSSSSSSSTSYGEISDLAKAAIADINGRATLKRMYYEGFWEQYNGSTSSYAAYLNQINNTNSGTLGDGKVRDYLKKTYGIKDEEDFADIYAWADIPYNVPVNMTK